MRISFLLLGLFLFAACGDEESSSPSSASPSADASTDTSPTSDASATDAAADECTPQGYECHLNPTCKPEYMPLSNISCGERGGFCCVKGALPPADASTGG